MKFSETLTFTFKTLKTAYELQTSSELESLKTLKVDPRQIKLPDKYQFMFGIYISHPYKYKVVLDNFSAFNFRLSHFCGYHL